MEVQDGCETTLVWLFLEELLRIVDPTGLTVVPYLGATKLAENQGNVWIPIGEVHQRLDDLLKRAPRVAVSSAVFPVVRI